MVTIYALVDPTTHEVRYVGQTYGVSERFLCHIASASGGKEGAVYDWIRQLGAKRPVLVVLQRIKPRYIWFTNGRSLNWASVTEAKWMKRFRRTILNTDAKACQAYDEYVNTHELDERYGS